MEQESNSVTSKRANQRDAIGVSRLIAVILLIAIIIAGGGYLIFEQQKQNIQRDAQRSLAGIAKLKVDQISLWRKGRLDDAVVLTEGTKIAATLDRWLKADAPNDADSRWMLARLSVMRHGGNYDYLGLLDLRGEIRLATNGELEHDTGLKVLALDAIRTHKVVISDLHLGDEDKPEIEIVAPLLRVERGRERAVGALYFHIDPAQFLYPLIQSWPSESHSAETLLVSREKGKDVYLNELRHRKGAALTFTLPNDISDLPGSKAALGQTGHTVGLDYRHHKVVAYMLPVPDSGWSMVAKIDEDEIYAPVRRLAYWSSGITLLMLGASFAVGWAEMRRSRLHAHNRALRLEKSMLTYRFEDLSKFANDIFFLMDEDGRIVEVNDKALDVYGYSREELLQMRGADLRTQEAAQQYRADWQTVMTEGHANYETVHRRKGGGSFPVDVSIRLLHLGHGRFVQSVLRDISKRKETEQRLHYLAYYDDLTGLPNRTLFIDHLGQAMSVASRRQQRVGVMLLDLDHFKNVNDTLGHGSGDILLHDVASRLKTCFRDGDTLSRFGGDEFAVILADMSRSEDAAQIALKILKTFELPFVLDGHEIFVGVSVGITVYPSDGQTSGDLMRNVDAAMYHAKEKGRGSFQFYSSELTERAQRRMDMESGLRRALERGEFVLHYQPQIDLNTGCIVGLEALVRWDRPGIGMVSPVDFIPVAEESGLIVPIGEWILRTACTQAKMWQDLGFPQMTMAVNISSRQFSGGHLVELVKSVLQETELAAKYLELEITESLLMDEADVKVLSSLEEFKQMGITMAIDDFGTGYSSLSYLKRFPIDKLKIDKSFVRGLPDNAEDTSLVQAIIAIARSLQLTVIAEGVETEEQKSHLRNLDCDQMQGYLFSRPLSSDRISELLDESTQV